jgi:hypothetical protein
MNQGDGPCSQQGSLPCSGQQHRLGGIPCLGHIRHGLILTPQKAVCLPNRGISNTFCSRNRNRLLCVSNCADCWRFDWPLCAETRYFA